MILKARVPTRLRVVDRRTGETITRCLEGARLDEEVESEIDAVFPRVVQVSVRDEASGNRRAER
eukprot:7974662-Pyramimonas_sp.AAC.1